MTVTTRPRIRRIRRIPKPIRFLPLVACANPACSTKVDDTFYVDGFCESCRKARGLPPRQAG